MNDQKTAGRNTAVFFHVVLVLTALVFGAGFALGMVGLQGAELAGVAGVVIVGAVIPVVARLAFSRAGRKKS